MQIWPPAAGAKQQQEPGVQSSLFFSLYVFVVFFFNSPLVRNAPLQQ